MAHDASNNNPLKESMHALIGAVMLLVMIGGIAVSAWLRPAGEHTVATVPATEAGKKLEEAYTTIEKPAGAAADSAANTATADVATTETATTDGAAADAAAATTDGADASASTTDNAQTADAAAEAGVVSEQAQAEQASKEAVAEQAPAAASQ